MIKIDKSSIIKALAIIVIVIVVFTFFLFFTFRIKQDVFWIVIAVCALIAYFGIPFLRKRIK